MATLFVRHTVNDYARWKAGYDDFASVREEMGVTAASVHRDPDDPNTLMVVHEFATVDDMLAFVNSDELRDAMKNAGVVGQPVIWLSEDIEHTEY
jgi:quinol monooxygenase YgiN